MLTFFVTFFNGKCQQLLLVFKHLTDHFMSTFVTTVYTITMLLFFII